MSTPAPQWFKSSYSADQGQCVEVAASSHTVHIRDSKQNPSDAPTLRIAPATWASFTEFASR
ncbi:DUF397 domain-containing protein [Streptomyces sp. NPDC016566]|uniref:DUF397 domain-containing protein n=1 Tax=Streptomyces sp. NPDC016566 TaxID=3364967 RepID=UPI003702B508